MPLFNRGSTQAPLALTGSAYGVRLNFEADDRELLAAVRACLPPAWEDDGPGTGNWRFRLTRESGETCRLWLDDHPIMSASATEVVDHLERTIRTRLALSSKSHLFLHAGAVSLHGRGIVVPGATFAGKTTLVAALVRAGATYFSDENAVIDSQGLLHPYPKPLQLRLTPGDATQTPHAVGELGGVGGTEPVPVTMVVVTHYRPGASWQPEPLSRAETILALIQHTTGGLDRPHETMAVMRLAAEDAIGLKGERGDAEIVATALIARISDGGKA